MRATAAASCDIEGSSQRSETVESPAMTAASCREGRGLARMVKMRTPNTTGSNYTYSY